MPAASALDDRALVEALRRDEPWARAALVEKYEPHIERVVAGALGLDPDLADIIQDVFVRVRGDIVRQAQGLAALPLVGLETDIAEQPDPVATVGQDELPGVGAGQFGEVVPDAARHHAAVFLADLVEHHQRVD